MYGLIRHILYRFLNDDAIAVRWGCRKVLSYVTDNKFEKRAFAICFFVVCFKNQHNAVFFLLPL